jgi:3-dehydroquinate synthase
LSNTPNSRIETGRGILRESLTARLKALRPRPSKVLVVLDPNAKEAVGRKVEFAIRDAGLNVEFFRAPRGENRKTMESVLALSSRLVRAGADRKSFLLAVGGGITSDLAGFTAASLLRGIPWGVVSTTLLAMADASIGGKTGVNLPEGKNLVGAFHFPKFVLMDVRLLRTLPEREWRCGMGEVLKTAMLAGPTMHRTLMKTPAVKLRRGSVELEDLVSLCARHKRKVVRRDPREDGERKLLNLGHTFGHALETAAGPRRLLHGEAVALGLLCALGFGLEQGLCREEYAMEVQGFLKRNGMQTAYPGELPRRSTLRKLLLRDKKASYGKLDLVLPVRPGTNLLVQGVDVEEVLPAFRHLESR